MTFHKPKATASLATHLNETEPRGIYRGAGCTVTIIELPLAQRYKKVFAFLQTRCPNRVPQRRWADCIRDGAPPVLAWKLSGSDGTSADLFGLPPVPANPHPSFNRMSRLDNMGLCWVLLGRRVTSLTADTATIVNEATGSRTAFRRGRDGRAI